MDLIKEILSTAPRHEPEFESRIYDMAGRLLAVLAMEKPETGSLYTSEVYAGPNIHAIVTLYRDGAPVVVVAHGIPIGPGFSVNANITDPNAGLGLW